MSTKERFIPSQILLLWRKNFLLGLKKVKPIKPETRNEINLSPGNKKTGRSGKLYKSVFVWNLPSIVTCPGVSDWCLENCYNADTRESVFPVNKWAENWWMVINQPQSLYDNIIKQLSEAEKPCAVRIHSSGDFFSEVYIELWINLAESSEETTFWAYTRSWTNQIFFPLFREP